jgi:hypothetical protein
MHLGMREWQCVQVDHHNKIGITVQEFEEHGWHLHTYTTGSSDFSVTHYLLFVKGED